MKGSFRVSQEKGYHYRGWSFPRGICVKVWAPGAQSLFFCLGPRGDAKRQVSSFLTLLNLLYYPAALLSSPSDLLLYPTFLLLPRTSQPSCSLA